VILALLAAIAISVPVFGVDPSPSGSRGNGTPSGGPTASAPSAASQAPASASAPAPTPTRAPQASQEPKPDKSAKPERGPKDPNTPDAPVTLRGTVAAIQGGRWPEYTLAAGGKTYRLSAGPRWWWAANNPLAKFVGKAVTIGGEQESGSDEVDVLTINGTAIREPGRPPWAGGWKRVGAKHPGWAQWKVDKAAAKAAKDAAKAAAGTPTPTP
jgi:hypothetical protein